MERIMSNTNKTGDLTSSLMEELPFHVDAGRRILLFMAQMSSYHRFNIWMLPSGEPIPKLAPGEWNNDLIVVGDISDNKLHGNSTKAKAQALQTLQEAGYKPGNTAQETKELLILAMSQKTGDLTPYQKVLLRDIRDGHLTIWHDSEGSDLPDRLIRGGLQAWRPLADKGYIELLEGARFWTVTSKGRMQEETD